MKRILIGLVLIGISFSAMAEPSPGKIRKLMEVVGLLDIWTEQIELGKKQSREMGEQMLNQLMSQLNPTDEYRKRFTDAFNNYNKKLEAPWSAEEIVDVWASYYGPHFTDDEVDRLIEFYSSELGRKDVSVSKLAMVKFSEHFQREGRPILEKATQEYIEEMKILAKECNCRKQ